MGATLEARIVDDLDTAVRAGDDDRKRTLRLLRAAIKNAEIDAVGRGKLALGDRLDDDAVLLVVRHQAKQRGDAIELYRRGGRDDLAAQEVRELAILDVYLPQRMDAGDIERIARAQVAASGASGPGDIGRVMGAVMKALQAEANGRMIDGKLVSDTVRRLLAG